MDFQGDVFGYLGRKIIEDYDDALRKSIHPLTATPREETSQIPALPERGYGPLDTVGILGAGVGGLYTALILDSLNIDYEILEASDRTGGRLLTYNFPNGGCWRHEVPPVIEGRSGQLQDWNYEALGRVDQLLEAQQGFIEGISKLPTYRLSFYVKETRAFPLLQRSTLSSLSDIDVIRPFAKDLIKDLEQNVHSGWRNLMKHDAYSLRSFMSFKYTPSASLQIPRTHLSTNVINWCETFNDSTGSYDRGLTEAVLVALVESQTLEDVEWKCFKGGSQVLTDYMVAYLTANGTKPIIQFNKKVTSILQSGDIAMDVSVRGECSPRTYSHVMSTIPLPSLRMIELGGAGLNVMQKNALRKLQYGASLKVGMRFRSAWWTELFGLGN
ncbi:hypothetical protein DFJ58DRAFT_732818 [Suillus subalutaceus]|uniref:uncharacterized protein n=1 Tax=Suillus subalutaceus TaxID=48586 RepID=UPI001B87554F|nr:uncharacterized protein DFJ58DRAFT_732818 [Suillus subalutaceus]KAG1840600.1 hypothetical protein DFJ58DRAFT_732818 [Suillus subalutaceus]